MTIRCRLTRSKICEGKKCTQCSATTEKGERCKLTTCIRVQYCYIHAKKILHLEVKKSTLRNAGCGLFTTVDIKSGDKIVEYIGETLTVNQKEKRYPNNNGNYLLQINKKGNKKGNVNGYINAFCIRGIAAMANAREDRDDCNAYFKIINKKLWLVADQYDIKANSEIFAWYGSDYILPKS